MTKKTQTLVLFDIGGVLLKLDYSSFYERGAEYSGKTPTNFEEEYIKSGLEKGAINGTIKQEEYFERLQGLVSPTKLAPANLKDLISLFWTGQAEEVIETKRKVHKAGFSVGLFSNISDFGLEIIPKEYPEIFETYDGPKVYSFKIGAGKPSPKMYRAKEIQDFKKIIYIDDNESYVRTGVEQFNWQGIWFTPFIDKAESIRVDDTKNLVAPTKSNENFKKANSIKGLEQALIDFGINL